MARSTSLFSARRRRALVAVAVVPLAAGLAACGSSSGSSGSGGSQTLTIAMWTNPAAVAQTQKVDAEFEQQHPGVKIKLQTAPTAANAWPTLWQSLVSAKSVDVLAQFPPTPHSYPPASTGIIPQGTPALVQSGQFVDLSNQPFMKRFDPAAQKYAMGYNNGVYGVMTAEYVNNSGMFYKKDILAKYGLSVPTTYGEFISDLDTLKSKGITPLYVAGKDGYQSIPWFGIMNQLLMQDKPTADAPALWEKRAEDFWSGAQSWNDPVYADTAQRYEKILSYMEPNAAGVPAQSAPGVWAAKTNDFPFFFDGSFDGNTIAQDNPGLNFGFMAMPGTDTASWNRAALAPDLSWVVPTWSKHQTLAMQWLDLFTQPDNYAAWLKATGSISTEPSVPTPTLPWTDWLAAHASEGYPNVQQPWTSTKFPKVAGDIDRTKMQPFGSQTPADALKQAADAYKSAAGH
ncbi:raffinose/stachyose/melibiose transport system substrate-binding protein [Catenulispora sp. GAS73]|uniref:ABC transporter substrate-binding protein n=1 Tax=Catenulispora sp. GAS73 TaxID=3156269 RepID=UPI00351251F8